MLIFPSHQHAKPYTVDIIFFSDTQIEEISDWLQRCEPDNHVFYKSSFAQKYPKMYTLHLDRQEDFVLGKLFFADDFG